MPAAVPGAPLAPPPAVVTPPPPRAEAPVRLTTRAGPRLAVTYEAPTPAHQPLLRWLTDLSLVESIAELVPQLVAIPRSLSWVVQECSGNAFWSKRGGAIVVCYAYLESVVRKVGPDELRAVFFFTMLHELAHALIDELALPVVGREEDIADRFAATIMLANSRQVEALVPVAHYFRVMEREETLALWDEHPTDGQRFYDLTCLAWGAGPLHAGRFGAELPSPRRQRCEGEYQDAVRGWHRLLKPHSRVRDGSTFWPP